MDSQTFVFYLGQPPLDYEAAGPVNLERVLSDLETKHGKRRAGDLGLAFLASELRDYLTTNGGGQLGQDQAPAMLALLRQMLAMYEGQRLAPPGEFVSYWQDVRAVIRRAEKAAGPQEVTTPNPSDLDAEDGAAILASMNRLSLSDRSLVLDLLDRLLEDTERTAGNG